MNLIFSWFKRIRGFSTPFGGISWTSPTEKLFDVPQFDGTIAITSSGNDDLIAFLERYAERVVYMRAIIDACIATQDQADFVKASGIDIDALSVGGIERHTYELRNRMGKLVYISFDLLTDHKLKASFGGTGVTTFAIRGFFEIVQTIHAGPSQVFHLTEVEAPLDARLAQTNRCTAR